VHVLARRRNGTKVVTNNERRMSLSKGNYIATRQRSHNTSHAMPRRIFGEVEERGCCFARQPPHKLNFRIMIQLDHHCTSFSCHATYNVPFLFIQIKELKSFYETTYKTTINCLISRLKITCHAWDYLLDDTNVLALRAERRRWESSTKSLIFRISKMFSSNN